MKWKPWTRNDTMIKLLEKFEHYILDALILMLAFVVLVSTIELGWIIIKDLIQPPKYFLEIADLKEIFGFFLMVLIGIELLETMKAYIVEKVIHVAIILEVAIIAIARKIIILDFEKYDGLTIIGTASLIASVAIAFLFVKRKFHKQAKMFSGLPSNK
jgi:uncharacterized membrane protein (DUF373 family)